MTGTGNQNRLKKELSLLDIYAIATGATLSSGFFLLPGIAAAQAGPAVVVAYIIAAIHLIPAVFSMAELSTAMPRAGGIYFFLDRSLGPLFGIIGGLGTWLVMILKTAFALIGMGAYLAIFFPRLPIVPVAIILALAFGAINLFGAKKTSGFQVLLVVGITLILVWFTGSGIFEMNLSHFVGFFDKGFDAIYGTAGMVYISYVGITNIASVSEEVKNPEKNLPRGMLLALITAILLYAVSITVMIGVLPREEFYHDLTPVASAAKILAGEWGAILLTIAAILAFFSVTNAAILSASRYPLAMSRDKLAPAFFGVLSKHGTPKNAIYVTVFLVVLCMVAFDPTKIAKLASGFQLLLFALSCLAVIIMRESKIDAYDPGFRSPLYPWMQIFGIIAPFFLIAEMGWYTALFTTGLILLGAFLYFKYAKGKIIRDGAIYHIFARLGENRFEGLDRELRGILKEKGLRSGDPFDIVIAKSEVIDLPDQVHFFEATKQASTLLADRLNLSSEFLQNEFMQGTRVGATPVANGVALPHLRLPNIGQQIMVVVRAKKGVLVNTSFTDEPEKIERVFALFFLISSTEKPRLHLRMLAQIATVVEDENFMALWFAAKNEIELKEIFLRDERFLSIVVNSGNKTAALVGITVKEMDMPEGSLIAMIHRHGDVIIPRGSTVLNTGDQLTIIGEPMGILKLKQNYENDM
jgi:amino acid transporter/mannitol/fructose-specific phosphotransferase system IIA component (Ntr-type)